MSPGPIPDDRRGSKCISASGNDHVSGIAQDECSRETWGDGGPVKTASEFAALSVPSTGPGCVTHLVGGLTSMHSEEEETRASQGGSALEQITSPLLVQLPPHLKKGGKEMVCTQDRGGDGPTGLNEHPKALCGLLEGPSSRLPQ